MDALTCLALIIYFESRGEPVVTQIYVAKTAIARAKQEKLSICKSMVKPKSYSFYWDRRSNLPKDGKSYIKAKLMALKAINSKKFVGTIYFNNCNLKKRYKTKTKLKKLSNLCFY